MARSGGQQKLPQASGLRILYEDNHLLGVYKPGSVLIQGDRTGDTTLLAMARDYIKTTYAKPGNVFLGLVHRLDRPVSGVVLFARTSKAASRLAADFRFHRVRRVYFAVVAGTVREGGGELVGYIERAHLRSRLTAPSGPRAKEARLSFRVLARKQGSSLLEIRPSTGRHHQIRLQMADFGHPVLGDIKYGAAEALADKTVALHAGFLAVKHPTRGVEVTLAAPPPSTYPWTRFGSTIADRFG